MKAVRLSILFALLCLAPAPLAFAQGEASSPPPPPPQGSFVSASGASSGSLDGMGVKRYLLGPGDVLELRVFNEPQFSGPLAVTDEGNVEVPFIGTIPARCRTDAEIRKEVTQALSKYLRNPQVSLRIIEARSRPPATVFGAVRGATRVDMRRKVRLLDLLAVAGGVTEQASGDIQIFHTETVMCPERDLDLAAQESNPAAAIDGLFSVYKLTELKMGKPDANPYILPGDIVIVGEAPPVYVTGAVKSPQGLYLREKLQLTRVIAMVGGTVKGARTSKVRVYRLDPKSREQKVIEVDYEAIRKQKQPDFFLEPYDVIEVPEEKGFVVGLKNFVLNQGVGGAGGIVSSLPIRVLY